MDLSLLSSFKKHHTKINKRIVLKKNKIKTKQYINQIRFNKMIKKERKIGTIDRNQEIKRGKEEEKEIDTSRS